MQSTAQKISAASPFSFVQEDPDLTSFKQDVFKVFTGQASGNLSQYMYSRPRMPGDKVNGKNLFDQLCSDPEYYLRDNEAKFLKQISPELANLIGPNATLFEFGPGTLKAVKGKTEAVLKKTKSPLAYIGIDINPDFASESESYLRTKFSNLPVKCFNADFLEVQNLSKGHSHPVFLCFGNTLGNFPKSSICPNPYAVGYLQKIRKTMGQNGGRDGLLIIGQDCNQDEKSLLAAYRNKAAHSWLFNLLNRIERDTGVAIDQSKVEFYAEWNKTLYCMELGARLLEDMTIIYDNIYFDFRKGHKLHLWNSHKYPVPVFQAMAEQAGFRVLKTFADKSGLSAVYVLGSNDAKLDS